jgi:NAD(P)-dependent dehydrogenase (short-subunit alcohol dehydrogenase family)
MNDLAPQLALPAALTIGVGAVMIRLAEVALFLVASERLSYVTGSTHFVDGGIVRHAEAL